MDPSPENNRAVWYQGPMKLEVVKSCGATQESAPFVLGGHEISDCTKKLLTQIHCKLLLFISKITICKMLAVAT